MKVLKLIVILILVYIGIVVAFESLLGYFQPANQSTLVITTTDEDGNTNDRVLARLESNGQIYVSANHWPRAWFTQALENPKVEIAFEGTKSAFLAVPVSNEEHDRVERENRHGSGPATTAAGSANSTSTCGKSSKTSRFEAARLGHWHWQWHPACWL